MVQSKSYSPVVLLTGAGCSVPYGLPDMRGFAQEMYTKLQKEGTARQILEMISRILYGKPLPIDGDMPSVDLEGLLVALTSISQYPVSDNPGVSYLMAMAGEATNELINEITSLAQASTTLTDLLPNPTTNFMNPETSLTTINVINEPTRFRISDGLDQARRQANVVTEAAANARRVLGRWDGSMNDLPRHASSMLDRVKASISGRYSSCDPELVQTLFGPLFEILNKRCHGFLDLFTLNYDPSVEIYCQTNGVKVVNGFSVKGLESVWADNFHEAEGAKIRLYKLHGSVTLYAYEGKIIEVIAGFGAPTIPTLSGIQANNMLIYPIVAKPTWTEPYLSLFGHLSEALNHAHCCVVIGFSYRDDSVVSALHQACARNASLKIVHCGMNKQEAEEIEQRMQLLNRMEFIDARYGDEKFIDELDAKIKNIIGY